MIADYHIHSILCKHAYGSPEEYVRTAIRKGIDEIGFADHCPYPEGFDARFRMNVEEFPEYKRIVFDMRAKFAKPSIRFGLEVDWVPGRMDEVFEKLDSEPFDYLIGSVHYTDEFPFDNPEIKEEWKNNDLADKIWRRYMELLLEMVSSGRFNIIGHFDLPKKFKYYSSDMDGINRIIAKIFAVASDNGTAIEINSSGLRKPVAEIYPSLEILRMAKNAGVRITFGSDAHRSEDVGADFDKAIALAKLAGYKEFYTFKDKNALSVPLMD